MATKQPRTLSFHFQPADSAAGDDANPHAKKTTLVDDTVAALKQEFGDDVLEVVQYAGERTVRVTTARIVDICRFLRDNLGFTYLCDLGGGDRFTEDERFEVHYNIVNMDAGKRIRIKVRTEEESPVVPSVTSVFPAADWNEREAWDMFGIRFEGHEDLRRMFMPEDFEYHPLRKEFPLLGIPGSLPLPPQVPTGELTLDPFPRAHGSIPPNSFDEVESEEEN